MAEDLERALRTALKDSAAAITVDRLIHQDLRPARRQARVRPALIAAACAIAITAGLATAYVLNNSRSPSNVVAAPPAAQFVGKRWQLSAVEHAGKRVTVPTRLLATIAFTPDGLILMSDSVNALSGHYTTTSTGFTASQMMSTLVGFVGADPTRKLVIEAIDTIAWGPMTNGRSDPSVAVGVRDASGQLVLTVADYTMTFDAAGIATNLPAPSPTSPAR